MDLIGPVRPSTRGGKNYIFIIIDDYSRFTYVALLHEKSDTTDELQN